MKARRSLLAVALLSSILGAAALTAHAATVTRPDRDFAAGATSIDWAIDAAVAARNLAAPDAALLREQLQMQFQSLSAAAREQVVAAGAVAQNTESAMRVVQVLNSAMAQAARQAEAAARQADVKFNAKLDPQSAAQAKLGADGDLVYLATVGPCRIYDSRFGPGQLPPTTARQVYTMSIFNGYAFGTDQGGSGVTGSGNCVQTAFAGTRPTAVVATVTVVNTSASGALQAWNGGTTLTGGAVLNWNAGDRLSNTTVIPMDRSIAAYAGSGGKRDIGIYNNSGAPVDFVIDVVGYMIENQATALDCVLVSGTLTSLANGATNFFASPVCTSGYTQVASQPYAPAYGLWTGTVNNGGCRISNNTGSSQSVACDAFCCRVPGR